MAGHTPLTGASAHVGSRLLRIIEEDGCGVRCAARRPARVTRRAAATALVLATALQNRCRTADGETEARGIARVVDEQTWIIRGQ